jgi:hypothetical protein
MVDLRLSVSHFFNAWDLAVTWVKALDDVACLMFAWWMRVLVRAARRKRDEYMLAECFLWSKDFTVQAAGKVVSGQPLCGKARLNGLWKRPALWIRRLRAPFRPELCAGLGVKLNSQAYKLTKPKYWKASTRSVRKKQA